MDRVYPPEHGHRLSVRSRRPLRAQTLNFSSFANPHVQRELQTQRSRGHVLPTAPFASQNFVAQGARGHTSFSTFNSEPFVSNSAVPLSVRQCASKGAHAHVNNNAHPTVPSESALSQPNHLDTHAQLLISQVVRGQLNRESQIGAARSLPAVSSSTPSQSASSPLTANGLLGPSRCRSGTVPTGTDPTHTGMAHWSRMLDPDCNTGNRVHPPSTSCQNTNSRVVTNASLARSGILSKAQMGYRPIPFEQLNSQSGSPHRPPNMAYGSLTSGPYPTSRSLAKSLNPVVHSVQPSPRAKGQQNFLFDPAMHYTDYDLHPGVRSTADLQATRYAEDRNSNLPSTNTRVITYAQAPTINPCSANQFANPQSSSVLVHLRNDLACPSANTLQNSNSGAFSALSLGRSTPGGASRVVSSSQPSLYGFQPQATSNRLALCFDPSNSRQSTVTHTTEAGASSRLSALLSAASPTTRVQARIADVGSARAREEGKNSTPRAGTPKTPTKMKGRTPKRHRPRKKQPTTKSSDFNSSSNMTIEHTEISRSIFIETTPRMQGHSEKNLLTGDGDNSQQKGIQSGARGITCGEHYPNVSRPAASELRSRLPGLMPATDLCPKHAKSNEELAHASPRLTSTAVRTGDRGPVLHSSEVERHPSHSERNHVMHSIPLQLRLKASASVYSPASDDTQTPLTPRSTGDQSSPDATSLGDSEEAVKRKKESHGSTLAVSRVDMKQNGEKKLTQSQLPGAVKNQTSVPLKLRIRKSKTKSTRRAALSKRNSLSTKASSSKHGSLLSRPQRQSRVRSYTLHGAAGLTRQKTSSDECTDIKSLKTQMKSRIACGKQAIPKKARVSDTEVMTKKPCSSAQKTGKCDDQLMEAFARKGRTSDLPLITPVPIQEPRANLRLKANDFDAELANLQREGHIKPPQPFCQTEAANSEALGSRKLSCLLCTERVTRSQAFIHPHFPAKNFFLCRKCYGHVNSCIKAESSMVHVAISDSPSDVLRRVSLFVMVVESIIQGFPPSERDTREISKVHVCVSSRNPADLRKRAEFIDVPFRTIELLRVVLRRLGVTIQRNRLRWRLQPIRLPSCPDLIEIISHAIPPSLEDVLHGSTPGRDVWNKVFPETKLDTGTSSFRIVSNLMALIGVRLRHLCVHNSGCLGNQDGCLVQFDLLSVCSAMHRARVMVSGTIVESLFRVWDPDAAARYLEMTDARLANGTSTGRLSNTCSICTRKQDGHSYPFRFFSCLSCSHEFCSVCVSNILSPSEYALANAGAYKCLLCRVDATVHANLLRSGGLNEVVAKTKMANGAAAQNSSKSRPQLPMLLVSRDVRKQVMSDENSESRAQMIGFAKFCEEANSHICEIGPTCSEAHAPSSAFPTKATAIDGSGFEERCFSCKLPIENQVGSTGGHRQLLQDELPNVLRCVHENCGVVMHRECSPPDQSRRRRAGRPKWSCPRHKCHVCANRDDSRLFKCRTCALALCKEHMFKPSELYLYSEKLFACKECMKNLRAPRPCLMDRLPKRKSEFIQALNVPQAKRRRLAEKGMSDGLPPSYPGCIE